MTKTKNILVCPLNWGLGHASRIVNIIDMLLQKNANVIIAADCGPFEFLKQRFPECEFIRLAGFEPKYPKGRAMALKMALQFPLMKKHAFIANRKLNAIIKEKEIDIVISDNRYELNSKKVYCVLLTHQINIHIIGFQKLFTLFINWQLNTYFKKFDELWIPDFESQPWLSGKLSHGKKIRISNYSFIGPLSRFTNIAQHPHKTTYDVLVILSGPEPQRSIFEHNLEMQLSKMDLKVVFLLGKPELSQKESKGNILKISHLPDDKFAKLILSTDLIICRPGYSTIMDLAVFGKTAFFVPTPGQTEQEYLADSLMEQGLFYSQKQNKLDVNEALSQINNFKGVSLRNDFVILNEKIGHLLNM